MNKNCESPQGGFTMVELAVVMALLVPVLYTSGQALLSVNNTVSTNEARSALLERVDLAMRRIGPIIRPISQATLESRTTQMDSWAPMGDLTPVGGIRFQRVTGAHTLNPANLASVEELEFQLDSGETLNGLDDDGNGLVDDGVLMLTRGGSSVEILRGVSGFSIERDVNQLTISLTAGALRRGGAVLSMQTTRRIVMRCQ